MQATLSLLGWLLILAPFVPFVPFQHWAVRWFDFGKVHFTILSLPVFLLAFVWPQDNQEFWLRQGLLFLSLLYNGSILVKYTSFYRLRSVEISEPHSDSVTLLSANVLQFNTDYGRFLAMVRETDPDIVLTMESNEDWEAAMIPLERDYPYHQKVALENTYGMHLYSKLLMNSQVHYFVADDIPSIEAELRTREGYQFRLFCVHPPPPSPTEEENSKERDGELLSVAKKIREEKKTTVVVGDFNNVAWSRSTVLFRKTSETIDPRIGRGLHATFHAEYRLFRFPIDQIFHSADVFCQQVKTLPYFGSDHFPLFCKFYINRADDSQEEFVEEIEEGEWAEVEELIVEGILEDSEREDRPVE